MQIRRLILGGLLPWLVAGCQLLVPEDPPLEIPYMTADDFAWDELDIAQEYTYIGVPRVDCGYMQTALSETGRCTNGTRPYGAVIECHLESPASILEVGCLSHDDSPDLMVRLNFESNAGDQDLSSLGKCTVVGEGPAAGEPARYVTDTGYKACLIEDAEFGGILVGTGKFQRPGGLFIDLSHTPQTLQELRSQTENMTFDARAEIVLDTRLMEESKRAEYFGAAGRIFDFYRHRSPGDHLSQPEDKL